MTVQSGKSTGTPRAFAFTPPLSMPDGGDPRRLLVIQLQNEVTLVDVAVVRFLIACEAEGIELRHCAPYIREWMSMERSRGE